MKAAHAIIGLPDNEPAAGKEKLLIVDDEINLRKLLRLTFGFGRYQIYEACDGQAALDMAAELHPDVMLLDVSMPGNIDGFEVCRQIKSQAACAHTYVVLLTAMGQQTDQAIGHQAGADAYVVKPFSPIQLLDLVESRNAA